MTTSIVFTFIGSDKPGLVEKISNTVSLHHGNWLESRMSQLAGQFAGITRIQVATIHCDDLCAALNALSSDDLNVVVQVGGAADNSARYKHFQLNLIGNDRPGIVRELSSALATRNINVCEMNTNVTSAPMTADPLFEATADIQVPLSLDLDELSDRLEEISNDLGVDINLEIQGSA